MSSYVKTIAIAGLTAQVQLANAAPLTIENYVANDKGFSVSSTLISGKKEAILVNGLFNQSDALRVAANILDSGKTLTTIFVSYGDPDYYFGLQSLHQIFPNAKIIATPVTVKHIQETKKLKLDYWGSKMGNNAPKNILVPTPTQDKVFTLDGEQIELKGEGKLTYLWIPANKAVLGGNVVTAGYHVWTADDPTSTQRAAIEKALKEIKALKPELVIPAHMVKDGATDVSSVDFTLNYLEKYDQVAKQSKNSAEIIQKMKNLYPQLNGETSLDSLEMGAKVVKGEMKWP